jgi:hypothetical protein
VVDAGLLVSEFLEGQSSVTSLLGTNANGSIYNGFDLPERFNPSLGPAIQVYRAGGASHKEIPSLVDARVMVRAWADREQYSLVASVYAAVHDVLHGITKQTVTDGTIVRCLEVSGPFEFTDPETAWVATYAFYQVQAHP